MPPDHAAEMLPYDTFVGEFRVHYAGFFDPGFGAPESGGAGSRAVLEVRSHEVPFLIEDGQIVGRLVYERLIARPDKLYGTPIGSSYQHQGLALSKHFKQLRAALNATLGHSGMPARAGTESMNTGLRLSFPRPVSMAPGLTACSHAPERPFDQLSG